jgi:hypothetical protein
MDRIQVIPVLAVAALAGCASTPPHPIESGQNLTEITGQQDSFMLEARFIQDGTSYAVGRLRQTRAIEAATLIFINDRLECSTNAGIPGFDWQWVSQPDGLAYLASMLRLACGSEDEMTPRHLADATVTIPVGKQIPPEPQQSGSPGSSNRFVELMGAIFIYPVYLVAGFAVNVVEIPVLLVGESKGRALQIERAGIEPGMARDTVEKLLGPPTAEIALPGSATQVLAYVIGAGVPNFAGNWYAGVREERVVWTYARSWRAGPYDYWLDGLAEQAIEETEQKKTER